MALYRCASCGSPNVRTEIQVGEIKYNYVKGAIGTVVLGMGGAVAGIENKTQQIYICSDCGANLSYPMPESLKESIDKALIDTKYRSEFMSWNAIRMHYYNLEEGFADRITAEKKSAQKNSLLEYSYATKEEFEKAADLIIEYQNKLGNDEDTFSDENPMSLEEYLMWINAIFVFIENISKFFPESLPDDYKGLHKTLIQGYFCTYIYEKIYLKYGHYPTFRANGYSEEIVEYSAKFSFPWLFANTYLKNKHKTVFDFNFITGQEFDITPEEISSKVYRQTTLQGIYSNIRINYEFSDNEQNSYCSKVSVPRFILKDGKLFCWKYSHNKFSKDTSEKILEEFFEHFPEKEIEIKNKIQSYATDVKQTPKYKAEINSLNDAYDKIGEVILAKKLQIAELKKKTIGKNKALTQIAANEAEINNLESKSTTIENKIKDIENICDSLKEENFIRTLVEEMNYFIVLHDVEDVRIESNPIEENIDEDFQEDFDFKTNEESRTYTSVNTISIADEKIQRTA